MKEMKEKFERKIDVIKIVSLVALLLLIVPSMAAVFIPTPQTFSIKLENYYEMDIKNNRCDCQNINFTERNYDRPECLINQVELSGDYLHFGIDATRNRDNKGEYDKYNLNVIWHDAKLTVYYKETSDDEYKFYKNFSNEREIRFTIFY